MTKGTAGKVILVMFFWAICYPLITVGITYSPHLSFATLRAVLAGIALLFVALLLERPMPRGTSIWILIGTIGLGATTLGFFGMFHAAEFVSPGIATVVASTQPLLAALLAYSFLGETLEARGKIGLLLGFLGIALIASPGFALGEGEGYQIGLVYVVLAALGITVSNVLIKRLDGRVDPLMAMGWQMIIGSVPLGMLALLTERPSDIVWSGRFVFSLVSLSFAGTALVYWLWTVILQKVELNRANAFSFLVPIFGLSMGMIFFGEVLGWLEISGIILSLIGIYLVKESQIKQIPVQ